MDALTMQIYDESDKSTWPPKSGRYLVLREKSSYVLELVFWRSDGYFSRFDNISGYPKTPYKIEAWRPMLRRDIVTITDARKRP